jgi:hypothetical protein
VSKKVRPTLSCRWSAPEASAEARWFDASAGYITGHGVIRHLAGASLKPLGPFRRILTLSTGRSIPVKQIADRHLLVALGFNYIVADLAHMIKAEPWVRANRILRLDFYHNATSVP